MSFSLPSDISVQRQPLDNGMVYQFRHQTLGDLGHIVLQDRPDGRCHISSEAAGDPNDPITKPEHSYLSRSVSSSAQP